MPAQWLNSSGAMSGRATAAVSGALQGMSQPAQLRRLRQVLLVLFALWAVFACTRLIWALVPVAENAATPPPSAINPIATSSHAGPAAAPVDIERMREWHLFGAAGTPVEALVEPEIVAADSARDGIEKGARETRLNLILRGIVASTESGLGHAIIEHKSQQAVYAVDDKLPVSGRVILAKVMPRQVVLDNGGTYELLVLFDESKLGSAQPAVVERKPVPKAGSKTVDKRADVEATELARSYRTRLFNNPQSLAKVVNISAVREGSDLLGYRIRPGGEKEQFTQLGFKEGDMITSVNGIELNNPANTMRLYNAMRSAGEVVFELERENQPLTLSVSLDNDAPQ